MRPTKKFPDTRQEMFDISAEHLLDQMCRAHRPRGHNGYGTSKRAVQPISGAYRQRIGEIVGHCAIGICIPDDVYDPEWEGLGARDVMYENTIPLEIDHLSPIDLQKLANLAQELQAIHDTEMVSDWRMELIRLASRHGLSTRKIGRGD